MSLVRIPRLIAGTAVAFACLLPQAAQSSPTFIAGEYPAGVETASNEVKIPAAGYVIEVGPQSLAAQSTT